MINNTLKIFILLLAGMFISQTGYAQRILRGKVVASSNGQPVEGAIVIHDQRNRAITAADGTFELEVEEKKVTLTISHLAYVDTRTEVMAKKSLQKITLNTESWLLPAINLGLGEYNGPTAYIPFDEEMYREKAVEDSLEVHDDGVFTIVEKRPSFYGGMNNLPAYFASNFRYPADVLEGNKEGSFLVMFRVDNEGKAVFKETTLTYGEDSESVKAELIRLISAMPRWYPAYQSKKKTNVHFTLPIRYAANGYGQKN